MYSIQDLANRCGVSASRVQTVSRAKFSQVPTDFTEAQAEAVQKVTDYMRDNGLRSVKTAIAQMSAPPDVAPEQTVAGQGSNLYGQLADIVEQSSDELADQMTAAVLGKTLEKFGNTDGRRAALVLENFTQAMIPTDRDLVNVGMVLPGSALQSTPLLTASTPE